MIFMEIGNEKIKEPFWSKVERHKSFLIAIGIILLYILAKDLVTMTAVPIYGYEGEYLYSIETHVGKRIMDPPAITEVPGYSIVWYDNPEGTGYDISFPYYVERGVELYPQLEPIKYAIFFDSMGGSAVWSILREYGYPVEAPAPPQKPGYAFAGWYADHWYLFEYEFTTMPLNGITLYARWTPNHYTIRFETDGGSPVAPLIAEYQTEITLPADPEKTGFVFAGWYVDVACTQPAILDLMPLGGMTLYARWLPE